MIGYVIELKMYSIHFVYKTRTYVGHFVYINILLYYYDTSVYGNTMTPERFLDQIAINRRPAESINRVVSDCRSYTYNTIVYVILSYWL